MFDTIYEYYYYPNSQLIDSFVKLWIKKYQFFLKTHVLAYGPMGVKVQFFLSCPCSKLILDRGWEKASMLEGEQNFIPHLNIYTKAT